MKDIMLYKVCSYGLGLVALGAVCYVLNFMLVSTIMNYVFVAGVVIMLISFAMNIYDGMVTFKKYQ